MAPFGKVTYNPRTGRYHSQFGGFLSAVDLKLVINEERSQLESDLIKITERYLNGGTAEAEWQRQVIQAIKEGNLRSMMIAAGGKAALNQIAHNKYYFQQVRADLTLMRERLIAFSALHKNGDRTDGQLIGWMKYRSASVFRAFSRAEQLTRLGTQGANEAWRTVEASANHCPECPGHQTNGFVPVEEVLAIGVNCSCGGRCRCKIRYHFNPASALQALGGMTLEEKVRQINEKAVA